MKIKSGRIIQVFLSFLSYSLSGMMIFCPLFKAQNIAAALFITLIFGYLIFEINLFVFFRWDKDNINNGVLCKLMSVLIILLCICCVLILLTETIKDVSYISGRKINLMYYTAIALAILITSFYLCRGSEKGIFRFLLLTLSPIILSVILFFFSFLTTKSFDYTSIGEGEHIISSLKLGFVSGAFLACDTSVFFFVFTNYLTDEKGMLCKGTLRLSYLCTGILLFIFTTLPYFVFGKDLTVLLSDVPYSMIKLFPSSDMTELISGTRIIAFMVKSCIYIYSTAYLLNSTFHFKKLSQNALCLIIFSAIPIIFLAVSVFFKNLKFGAFQTFIYPFTMLLGLCFLIILPLCKKKRD